MLCSVFLVVVVAYIAFYANLTWFMNFPQSETDLFVIGGELQCCGKESYHNFHNNRKILG